LDLEDVTDLSMGVIWKFGKGTGLLYPSIRVWGKKGLFYGLGASSLQGFEPKYYSNSKILSIPTNVSAITAIFLNGSLWITHQRKYSNTGKGNVTP
jgi:hypothetical protein